MKAMNTKKNKWTLVTALEEIWRKADDCELSEEYFMEIKSPANYVKKVLGIDAVQSFIVSVLIDNGDPLAPRQIGHYAKCSNIKMMTLEDKFEDLRKRKFIKRSVFFHRGDQIVGYCLNPDFLAAVKANTGFSPKFEKDFSAEETMEQIGRLLKLTDAESSLYPQTVADIHALLDNTQHVEFSRKLNAMELTDQEMMMYLTGAYLQIMRGHAGVNDNDYGDILRESKGYRRFILDMNNGKTALVKNNLMENDCNDGVAVPSHFKLTEHSFKDVFPELNYDASVNRATVSGLLMPDKVDQKELFYNEREASQVHRLAELLDDKNFKDIQERLKAARMRPGFACLFYGSPGTGKTETVLQICKQTGRPIFQVNVSELKSKWVGESEKRVQALFDQYARMVQESELCPILLFNEADAIIGKRTTNATQAVDKMENSIQNIILQAMEKLNGILIATTNLTENMDDAFERRFLYKIRFDKPGQDVKARIWRSMLPDLEEKDAQELAGCYDFSGGQIENIARKQTVDSILYDNPVSLSSLKSFCEEESIKNKSGRKLIGFCR